MKYWNGKEITARYLGTRALQAAYKGAVLVWQLARDIGGWFHGDGWFHGEAW